METKILISPPGSVLPPALVVMIPKSRLCPGLIPKGSIVAFTKDR